MGRLTKADLKYLERFPMDGVYTCTYCGKTGQGYWVQPVLPRYAGREGVFRCTECAGRQYREWKEARRQALAARPRCVACKRIASYELGSMPLCGRHAKVLQGAVLRKYGTLAVILSFDGGLQLDRDEALRLIREAENRKRKTVR